MTKGSLIFNFSVMNAGKTNKLLEKAFTYENIGKKILLMKPSVDVRDTFISSRNGLKRECILIDETQTVLEAIGDKDFDILLIDECQFLTKKQVKELRKISTKLRKIVFCFGLKNNFKGKLFKASKILLSLCDILEESTTLCHCGNKATMILKYDNNTKEVIKKGEEIDCGYEDKYLSVCYKHWKKGDLGIFS